jgi:antitoxin MazE
VSVVRTEGIQCPYGREGAEAPDQDREHLAVVLDRPVLEATGIDGRTPLAVSTDGDVVVISPVRSRKRAARFKAAADEINEKYAGVFRRLAE